MSPIFFPTVPIVRLVRNNVTFTSPSEPTKREYVDDMRLDQGGDCRKDLISATATCAWGEFHTYDMCLVF
jgi:hypothetical protein